MYCVSVHQPWASLIVAGVKRVMSAGQPTVRRGRIGVYACRHVPRATRHALKDPVLGRAMRRAGIPGDPFSLTGLGEATPLGLVIGTADLVDCLKWELTPGWMRRELTLYGDIGRGKYVWVFEDPKPLAVPVAAQGNIALFQLDLGEPGEDAEEPARDPGDRPAFGQEGP